MCLCANAVKFILHKELIRHGARDVRKIGGRSCQHELDGMKQAHVDVREIVSPRAHSCFSEIAKEHIHTGDGCKWTFKGAGNSILDQSLSKTNSQIPSQKLDEIFGFKRRCLTQDGYQQAGLVFDSTCFTYPVNNCFCFEETYGGTMETFCSLNSFMRSFAGITEPNINRREFLLTKT